ncbi:MAG: hypothetical protein HZA50_07710 [Planctomycetes bacterium]|nr:hypothetical protein [Planctomycetota bacterium]
MDQRKTVELQRRWWKRQNTEVLAGHYCPVKTSFGGLDLDIPPKDIGQRKRANAQALLEAAEKTGSDVLVAEGVNFSVAMVPAVAGAGFAHDEHTSWSIPVAQCIADVKVNKFDRGNPMWVQYERRLEELLKHWGWDSYLPSLADYLGPMDILAGMLGPENLSIALMEEPDEVRRRAMDAADFLREMIAYEVSLHRSAGMTEGVTNCFGIWLEDSGVLGSEDFSALVGLGHFREFFVEPLSRVYESLDSCFLHMHSAAIQCLPGILEVSNLGGIELGNDPGGPDLDKRIAAGRMIQQAGKPLQMGSWNIPLSMADMERIVKSLDPRGLLIRFQAKSQEEARDLYQAVKQWGGSAGQVTRD